MWPCRWRWARSAVGVTHVRLELAAARSPRHVAPAWTAALETLPQLAHQHCAAKKGTRGSMHVTSRVRSQRECFGHERRGPPSWVDGAGLGEQGGAGVHVGRGSSSEGEVVSGEAGRAGTEAVGGRPGCCSSARCERCGRGQRGDRWARWCWRKATTQECGDTRAPLGLQTQKN